MPKVSAACIAIDALEPPISVDPSTRLIVPSLFTVILQDDCNPTLNQYPTAIPLPLFGPSNDFLYCGEFFMASKTSVSPTTGNFGPSTLLSPSFTAFNNLNSIGSIFNFLEISSITCSVANAAFGDPGAL